MGRKPRLSKKSSGSYQSQASEGKSWVVLRHRGLDNQSTSRKKKSKSSSTDDFRNSARSMTSVSNVIPKLTKVNMWPLFYSSYWVQKKAGNEQAPCSSKPAECSDKARKSTKHYKCTKSIDADCQKEVNLKSKKTYPGEVGYIWLLLAYLTFRKTCPSVTAS